MTQLILASSSPYRKQLLDRLKLDFICISPEIDERANLNESPQQLVERLALEKAEKIAESHPERWVIGSDQTASFDGQLIGKPGSIAAAEQQLGKFGAQTLCFYTSICLLNLEQKFRHTEIVETKVVFRKLDEQEIRDYVALDNPIDCAGSFKAESLGISLFESLESTDPTALIGLPLISLCRLMREARISGQKP
jgi:septum formation protein